MAPYKVSSRTITFRQWTSCLVGYFYYYCIRVLLFNIHLKRWETNQRRDEPLTLSSKNRVFFFLILLKNKEFERINKMCKLFLPQEPNPVFLVVSKDKSKSFLPKRALRHRDILEGEKINLEYMPTTLTLPTRQVMCVATVLCTWNNLEQWQVK